MATIPYAKIQVSVNGGAQQTGGLTVGYGDTIQLSGESVVAWEHYRWEIFDYPPGWTVPAGWSTDSISGVYFSTDLEPPLFTLPSALSMWGKWMFRLRINDALTNEKAEQKLSDESTAIQIIPSNGLLDVAAGETNQFDKLRDWVGALKIDLRALATGVIGGGLLVGDATGPFDANIVARIHGATVPAAGALTTGNVLQVTGASALGYGPVNLGGGANYVTGVLPVGNLPNLAGDVTGPATSNIAVRATTDVFPFRNAAAATKLTLDWTSQSITSGGSTFTTTARVGFASGVTNPVVTIDQSIASANATPLFVIGQKAKAGASWNGGSVLITGGEPDVDGSGIPTGAGQYGQIDLFGGTVTIGAIFGPNQEVALFSNKITLNGGTIAQARKLTFDWNSQTYTDGHGDSWTTSGLVTFANDVLDPTITQARSASGTTQDISILSQRPAVGSNGDSGDIFIQSEEPDGTGHSGQIAILAGSKVGLELLPASDSGSGAAGLFTNHVFFFDATTPVANRKFDFDWRSTSFVDGGANPWTTTALLSFGAGVLEPTITQTRSSSGTVTDINIVTQRPAAGSNGGSGTLWLATAPADGSGVAGNVDLSPGSGSTGSDAAAYYRFAASGLVTWRRSFPTAGILFEAKGADVATQDFTITGQGPFATASVNLDPGNLVFAIPDPVGTGLTSTSFARMGQVKFQWGGTHYASFSRSTTSTVPNAFADLRLGSATQSGTNWVVQSDATTQTRLNVGDIAGVLHFLVGGPAVVAKGIVNQYGLALGLNGDVSPGEPLYINVPSAGPLNARAHVVMQAAGLGALSLRVNAADNASIYFDGTIESDGAGGNRIVAKDTSIVRLRKRSQGFYIGGIGGTTVGTTFTSLTDTIKIGPFPSGNGATGTDLGNGTQITFTGAATDPVFGQERALSDTPTYDLKFVSQEAFLTATGTNREAGNIKFVVSRPTNGLTSSTRGVSFEFLASDYPESFHFGPWSGTPQISCIWAPRGDPLSLTNTLLTSHGISGVVGLDSWSASGHINFGLAGNIAASVYSDGFYFPNPDGGVATTTAYKISQFARTAAGKGYKLSIAAQSAATGLGGDGGDVEYITGAADGGSAEPGSHYFKAGSAPPFTSSTTMAQFAHLTGVTGYALWLGGLDQTAAHDGWVLYNDGGNPGVTILNAAGATGEVRHDINGRRIFRVYGTAGTGSPGTGILSFHATNVTGAQITQDTPTTDVATHDLTFTSQAPFASATVNQTPGSFRYVVPVPVGSGSKGAHWFSGGNLYQSSDSGASGANGAGFGIQTNATRTHLTANQYFDGVAGVAKFSHTGGAGSMQYDTGTAGTAGDIFWTTAPSTTADTTGTLTERMRLKQGGVLQILGLNSVGVVQTDASGNLSTGSVPTGLLPDATSVAKGVVQLAGDLAGTGGTAAAPRVSGLTGISGTLAIAAATMLFGASVTAPTFTQETSTTGSGQPMSIIAQAALAGSDGDGGLLLFQAGAPDGAGSAGIVQFKRGTFLTLELGDVTIAHSPVRMATYTTNGIAHFIAGNGSIVSSLIVDADVATGAALGIAKIAPGTNGQLVATVSGATAWATPGGDVTGAPSAFVVGKINGATVPAAGSLTTGQVLRVTGASALGYGAVDLANSNAITGALPLASIAQGGATSSQVLAWNGSVWAPASISAVGFVPTSRTLTAGAGLTGGGDLSADRTFDVVANADGSIVVNANDIQVGVLATDAQHGNRGGGALHAAVASATAGFVPSIGGTSNRVLATTTGTSATWTQIVDAMVSGVAWGKISATPTTLSGYGITDAASSSRTLTGSGAIKIAGDNAAHDLSADRTISVASAASGVLGVLQLDGDLAGTSGTAASPKVSALTGISSIVAVHATAIAFDETFSSAQLTQAGLTSGADGNTLYIIAQGGFQTSGDWNGGDLSLSSGAKHGAGVAGSVLINIGGVSFASFDGSNMSFSAAVVSPGIRHTRASSGSGTDMLVAAQSGANSGDTNGATLFLSGGVHHGTGLDGGVALQFGGNSMVELAYVNSQRVVAIGKGSAISGSDFPVNLVDRGMYIADATGATLATQPSNGHVYFSFAGRPTWFPGAFNSGAKSLQLELKSNTSASIGTATITPATKIMEYMTVYFNGNLRQIALYDAP